MTIQEVIAKKRDGIELSADAIDVFINGYVQGTVADYQAAAFLMATYLRGMTGAETALLTQAMANSGERLDLSQGGIPANAPTIDKHSTGGVGDKTSLIVVPLLAAAGAFVCKMSGRGLGHTGGTLDKLESIPGFRIGLSPQEMIAQVGEIGACLAGQTDTLAPADKKLYALRDATATVGSLPLIVSSILSKKLAGGAESFLFDVKVGDGALVRSLEEAELLAHALVDGAVANGRRATAVLSDMNMPLGKAVGNALEIAEAIEILSPQVPDSEKDARLWELCLTLTGEGLALCGLAESPEAGRREAERVLRSGAGWEKFREIVVSQGGDGQVMETPRTILPQATVQVPVFAEQEGYISRIAARRIGETVVMLGGGRKRKEDTVDPAVGILLKVEIGDFVKQGSLLGTIHASDIELAQVAMKELSRAIHVTSTRVLSPPLIHKIIF